MLKTNWKIRTGGLLVGMLISGLIGSWLFSGSNEVHEDGFQLISNWTSTQARDPKAVAASHLNWAETRCLSEVENPIQRIRDLFIEARSQTRTFAEEALGWDTKLTIVSDYFQQTDELSMFLKQKFETLVISEARLLSALEREVEGYHQATASVEGEMLVRLRSDAVDFKDCPIETAADAVALETLFREAIAQTDSAVGTELQAAICREVASYILSEIATHVGVQLSVSSGILSTSAATGWTNFGINLVIGLAVDQMVTAAYDAYADPKGQLANQINSHLDEMENLIIEGSNDHTGLRARLRQYARERSALRETAVLQLMSTDQGGAL